MIQRSIYLEKIAPFIDMPIIKVITGIRRSGKSVLLMLLKDVLLNKGVSPEQIISINFESLEYMDVDNAIKLYQYIKEKKVEKKTYILLDEIQNIDQW